MSKSKDPMSESQSSRQIFSVLTTYKPEEADAATSPDASTFISVTAAVLLRTRCEVGSKNLRPSFLALRLHRISLHFYFIKKLVLTE